MKKTFILSIVLGFFICLLGLSTTQAGNQRADGNWWMTLDKQVKTLYIAGFFEGTNLGYNMSYWKLFEDKTKAQCLKDVMDSQNFNHKKYFANVSDEQIVNGLNELYSDSKNRRIRIFNAIWVVLNGIAVTPKEQLDRMIEYFRGGT